MLDGDRVAGRVHLDGSRAGREARFWSVSIQLNGRKSYGRAPTLDEAKDAFKAEHETWKGTERNGAG